MLREEEVREALKFSRYTTALKSHVKAWLKEKGKADDDESAMNEIMQKAMFHYHNCVSSNVEWMVETADKLIKVVHDGRNDFWKLMPKSNTTAGSYGSGVGSSAASNSDGLNPAVYLLLLLGPIGWIIFFYMYKNSKK